MGKIEDLSDILSDAEIIDIDFSNWDKYISFYFLADHYNRVDLEMDDSILEVRFFHVTNLNFKFRHHNENDILDSDKHFSWLVDQNKIKLSKEKYYLLEFFQNDLFPIVNIEFKDVLINIVNSNYLNYINKNWKKQGQGFARPSIFKLFNIIKKKK